MEVSLFCVGIFILNRLKTKPAGFQAFDAMRYKTLTLLFLVLLAPVHSMGAREDGKSAEAKSADTKSADAPLVILRGRVKCLDDSCDGVSRRFEFIVQGNERYTFVEGDELAAIFQDQRVRSRELQISARLHAKQRLEIIKVKSVVNGRTNDLYYFCEVCNITAYAPGPCPCCRNELEFFEKPLP